jgi:hypothetical protein
VISGLPRPPPSPHTSQLSWCARLLFTRYPLMLRSENLRSSDIDPPMSRPASGTQWHPEKAMYEWNPDENINHSASSVFANSYMAWFLVSEARFGPPLCRHYYHATATFLKLLLKYTPTPRHRCHSCVPHLASTCPHSTLQWATLRCNGYCRRLSLRPQDAAVLVPCCTALFVNPNSIHSCRKSKATLNDESLLIYRHTPVFTADITPDFQQCYFFDSA